MKNLLSVSELVDQNYDVHFSKNKSTIKHTVSGEELAMVRDGKLWDIYAQVVPFEESRNRLGKTNRRNVLPSPARGTRG
eukprot:4352455-Karenia_brevis.AAC.1